MCVGIYIQGVPVVKVTISGFNSRADSESKTSYTHGSNLQRFWSYEFLNYGQHMAAGSLVKSQKIYPSRRKTLRTICLSVERLICNCAFNNIAQ